LEEIEHVMGGRATLGSRGGGIYNGAKLLMVFLRRYLPELIFL
jgi:hypothetical protein